MAYLRATYGQNVLRLLLFPSKNRFKIKLNLFKVYCRNYFFWTNYSKGAVLKYSIANYKYVFRTLFIGINEMFCIIIATYACLLLVGNSCFVNAAMEPTVFAIVYVPQTESLRLIYVCEGSRHLTTCWYTLRAILYMLCVILYTLCAILCMFCDILYMLCAICYMLCAMLYTFCVIVYVTCHIVYVTYHIVYVMRHIVYVSTILCMVCAISICCVQYCMCYVPYCMCYLRYCMCYVPYCWCYLRYCMCYIPCCLCCVSY